jgi:recombinational DNA repair protein (RecF pathway)
VEVHEDFWSLRQDGLKLAAALRLCGHLVRFALPGHSQDELMPLLFWSLKALEGGREAGAVEFRFLFRWCASLGISPQLDRCSSCGSPASCGLLSTEGLACGTCLGNVPRQGGLVLAEMELNRLRKAVMLSGKEFRAETFGGEEDRLFKKASALFLKLLEGSV